MLCNFTVLSENIIIQETSSTLSQQIDLTIPSQVTGLKPQKTAYSSTAAAAAKSLQLCPTLCDPIDGSPPGSPVPGILQARTLEWVAISFSNAVKSESEVAQSCPTLATPWTAAYQAPSSMGFSRQEYWSGVPLPSPIFFYSGV